MGVSGQQACSSVDRGHSRCKSMEVSNGMMCPGHFMKNHQPGTYCASVEHWELRGERLEGLDSEKFYGPS